jgi:hypothetical protein
MSKKTKKAEKVLAKGKKVEEKKIEKSAKKKK